MAQSPYLCNRKAKHTPSTQTSHRPIMKKISCTIIAGLAILAACKDGGEQFEIKGNISSAVGKTLYFEAVTLNGIQAADSVRLDNTGAFEFHGARASNPEFYRLRIGRQIINLSVDSTESLHVEADLPTMDTDYKVEGSDNCKVIKELSNKQIRLQQRISGLLSDSKLSIGEQERLVNEYLSRYKEDIKNNYILKDPAAPYAYFALFQAIGSSLIFNPINDPEDVKFVGAVATAWEAHYPGTERTENLRNIALRGMQNTKRAVPMMLDSIDQSKIVTSGIIDIELPDIEGRTRRLSDIKDKVVLLDFTAYSMSQSKERIMQMRTLYDKYSPQGFEIFQISIDPDEHYWKTACEYLPWVCVYDAEGESSSYLGLYQVYRLPAYFLINRQGDLVARDEQVADIEKSIKALCEE